MYCMVEIMHFYWLHKKSVCRSFTRVYSCFSCKEILPLPLEKVLKVFNLVPEGLIRDWVSRSKTALDRERSNCTDGILSTLFIWYVRLCMCMSLHGCTPCTQVYMFSACMVVLSCTCVMCTEHNWTMCTMCTEHTCVLCTTPFIWSSV